MSPKQSTAKRQPPPPEQVRAAQEQQAEQDHARIQANLPAPVASTAVAVPDNRTNVERYIDDVAQASIVGRTIKFNIDGNYVTTDDDAVIGEDVDFVALCDQTLVGY